MRYRCKETERQGNRGERDTESMRYGGKETERLRDTDAKRHRGKETERQ